MRHLNSPLIIPIDDEHNQFCNYIKNFGYQYLTVGGCRIVYVRKNHIIKIPLDNYGVDCNLNEAQAWRKHKNMPTREGICLAPCRLLSNGSLLMVRVDVIEYDEEDNVNHWSWRIDSQQVGFYKGKVVAYDYGSDFKNGDFVP